MNTKTLITWAGSLLLGLSSAGLAIADDDDKKAKSDWPQWGQNIKNTHNNDKGKIRKHNVNKLEALCGVNYVRGLPTPFAFSSNAEPIMVGDTMFWTGMGGQVGAVKMKKHADGTFAACEELWVQDVNDVLGLGITAGEPAVRISPAHYKRSDGKGTLLYIAVANPFTLTFDIALFTTPQFAFALDAETGDKIFQIPLTSPGFLDPESIFPTATSSPSIHKGVAYFGLASFNNALNLAVGVPLTARGQMFALDLGLDNADVPAIKWRQYTVPKMPAGHVGRWFSGAGVWSSSPSVLKNAGKDKKGLVFFSSGQLYDAPTFVDDCMLEPAPVSTPHFTTSVRGETGEGAAECYDRAVSTLASMGIEHPIASNSVIALNASDGSFAWHYPTAGLDVWQAACSTTPYPTLPGCTVPVAGPDWDISGNSPIITKHKGKKVVVSHNKGGSIFMLDAKKGKLVYSMDVCVGSFLGGIHWGMGYDPKSKTLFAPCTGSAVLSPELGGGESYRSILADGTEICDTGYLNAIDLKKGKLKWQALPARAKANDPSCPGINHKIDEQFKHGIAFDKVHKNKVNSKVPVIVMPDSVDIPVAGSGKARLHGIPTTSNGVVYMPTFYGTVYALDIKKGKYLHEMHCNQGAIYGGVSLANNKAAFGCGYSFLGDPADAGSEVIVYSLPKNQGDDDDDDDNDDDD